MTPNLTTRNATLDDLAALLKDQQVAKMDVVVPAQAIRAVDGVWRIDGAGAELTDQGVTPAAAPFVPTKVADEQVADALKIPLAYVRRMRDERPDLYDDNLNGWLQGTSPTLPDDPDNPGMVKLVPGSGPDPRSFLVRTFRGNGGPGVARALLSPRYKALDNLDGLVAALEGVKQAGVDINVTGCDLSERRMYVRLHAPEIAALAPALLAGYRSPFGGGIERIREMAAHEGMGYAAGDEPVVFAGLELSNSEVGGGAFSIRPRLEVKICRNGLTIRADAMRAVHLGARLDEGVVAWSGETQQRALALVTSQAADAVAAFLSPAYLAEKLAEFEAKAAVPLDNPAEQVRVVTTRLGIPEARQASVLDHFIKGGQMTLGGVAQAVSSVAQTIEDADLAAEWEALAVQALDTPAAALVAA